MELPAEPAVTEGAERTVDADRGGTARAALGTEAGPVVMVSRTNPLYGHDAPLIRVAAVGQPDPVTAAIAGCITESGSVYLELPDGRLTVVLDLAGTTWVPRARDEGIRG
jgi:hypothetical protein